MTYLYTLLGITAWVATIALSSSALISYENTKQAENTKSFIDKTTLRVVGIQKATILNIETPVSTEEVTPITQATTDLVSQPKPATVLTKPKATTVKAPVRTYRRESDGEDD